MVGWDTVSNASEFERADCAPRSTGGDGVINAADLAQVGRYVVGLDPLTPMGWPNNVSPSVSSAVKSKAAHSNGPGQPLRTISLAPVTQGALTDSVAV